MDTERQKTAAEHATIIGTRSLLGNHSPDPGCLFINKWCVLQCSLEKIEGLWVIIRQRICKHSKMVVWPCAINNQSGVVPSHRGTLVLVGLMMLLALHLLTSQWTIRCMQKSTEMMNVLPFTITDSCSHFQDS